MRFLSRRLALLLVSGAAALLAGCAGRLAEPERAAEPASGTVYVTALGWHTEVGLGADAMTGQLAALRRAFPEARYFMFGWGERDYFMAADPGFDDLLRALVPGPAVMLVRGLPVPPPAFFGGAGVYAVPASADGIARLSQYLQGYLDEAGTGALRRLGPGPYPESAFYAAAGTYDVGNTCNTWTAAALSAAGLPVSDAGVVFAWQVADQVRGIARPANAPPAAP